MRMNSEGGDLMAQMSAAGVSRISPTPPSGKSPHQGKKCTRPPPVSGGGSRQCSNQATYRGDKVGPETPDCSGEVEVVNRVASDFEEWHVVHPRDRSGLLQDVACDIDVLLVLCELHDQTPAREYVKEVRAEEENLPTLIVVLLADPRISIRPEAMLEAQQAFYDLDADDVIIKSGSAEDLRLAVLLAIFRVDNWNKTRMQYEKHIREQDQHRAQLRDTHNRMFWSHVHCLFRNFPRMQRRYNEGPPQPGSRVGDSVIGCRLGAGKFGHVYHAKNRTTGLCEAVKVVAKSKLDDILFVRAIWNECRTLTKLSHENIIGLHEFVHAPDYIFIHMELAGRDNLFQIIRAAGGCLSNKVSQRYCGQLSSAVAHCHALGVAHCDLKPENIVISLDGQQVKIVDFGCAMEMIGRISGLQGTMPFMAPEVLGRTPYEVAPVDVWALGVLLLEMLCGVGKLNRMLSWPSKVDSNSERACELEDYFNYSDAIPLALKQDKIPCHEGLVKLLRGVLNTNFKKRWSAADIHSACIADSEWKHSDFRYSEVTTRASDDESMSRTCMSPGGDKPDDAIRRVDGPEGLKSPSQRMMLHDNRNFVDDTVDVESHWSTEAGLKDLSSKPHSEDHLSTVSDIDGYDNIDKESA
jgi:aurora kinase